MTWVKRWGYWIQEKASAPGIFRLKSGGYLVRGRVNDRRKKKRRAVLRPLHDVTLDEARRYRMELLASLKDLVRGRTRQSTSFGEYAVSLFERKVETGEIKSAKGVEKWQTILGHHVVPTFGEIFVHEIHHADIEAWKQAAASKARTLTLQSGEKITRPPYGPRTINTWLSVMRVICSQMTVEFDLPKDPSAKVSYLDTSTAQTYTEEKPNALTPMWAKRFMAEMKRTYPQHFAMTLLGFCTGLRPSSLRPLRRSGPTPDVLWDEGVILVRRSNSLKQAIMDTTKTKKHQRISVPKPMMAALRAHVKAMKRPKMVESEFLFPSFRGGMRTRSVLDKPFADVAKRIRLPFPLTPRAMRRTFQDLAREGRVKDVVTRAISGHSTEQMQEHYSTVSSEEMRAGIGAIMGIVGARSKGAKWGARPKLLS